MKVSNRDLSHIMCMSDTPEVRELSRELRRQDHIFYVRSWEFTLFELYSLVQSIRATGFSSPLLKEWEFMSCVTLCNLSKPKTLTRPRTTS